MRFFGFVPRPGILALRLLNPLRPVVAFRAYALLDEHHLRGIHAAVEARQAAVPLDVIQRRCRCLRLLQLQPRFPVDVLVAGAASVRGYAQLLALGEVVLLVR